MNTVKHTLLALSLMAMSGIAVANEFTGPADLPPTKNVLQALQNHPAVTEAGAHLKAAQAEHERLRAGPHEYGLSLTAQRRNASGGPDYNEWSASLERAIRLPGKSDLDDRIGATGVRESTEKVGDARHETARQLLGLWYGALRAGAEARLWQQQAGSLEQEAVIVAKRVKRGDAAHLETLQANAALAQVRARLKQVESQTQLARAELKLRFPELPVPGDSAAEPVLPPGDAPHWTEHTLEHNHELLAVQRAIEKARLVADRADRDRMPDPTLGLHMGNEQGGDETLLGISVSIPLPGAARRNESALRLAQAEAVAATEAVTKRRLEAEALTNWENAKTGVQTWQQLNDAARSMSEHANLAKRAHELGELGLSESLLAQRNALETQIAAEQARVDANEAIARLLLDAHSLWPLGDAHHD